MKQWIALLVSFLLTLSAVITNAALNPADAITGGAGNGNSETVDSVDDFSSLLANLPTADAYYKYFSAGESEEGTEQEDIFGEDFKPLTLDTTSYYETSTHIYRGTTSETVYDVSNKNKLPPANYGKDISKRITKTDTTENKNYYEMNRRMEIHYLKDGLLLTVDGVLTTGEIKHEYKKDYEYTGYGNKTYIIGYDEQPIYAKDEEGNLIKDEDGNPIIDTPIPDETSPVDNLGNRRAYRFDGEGSETMVGDSTTVDTYTLTVYNLISSLYLTKGKVFMKYDKYDLAYKCYEERHTGKGDTVVTEFPHPDAETQAAKIRLATAKTLNEKFKGVWFDLNHEVKQSNLPDFSKMTEEEGASSYAGLTEQQKEEMEKASIDAIIGSKVAEIGESYAKTMLDIADNTAQGYGFFGAYLAAENAKLAAADSDKKYFRYSSNYINGKPQGMDEFYDFALSFLDERNFYDKEIYETEKAAYEEWRKEHSDESHNKYRRTEKSRNVYFENPDGSFTVNLISPNAPKLSYKISGSVDYTTEKVDSHQTGENEYEYTYEYKANRSENFTIDESITIRNVGNVKIVAPEKVDADFFDIIYPILYGYMEGDQGGNGNG